MHARLMLSAGIVLLIAGGLRAQHSAPSDPPKLLVPKHPPTRAEIFRIGLDALAKAKAGEVKLTYLYRQIQA